MNFQINNYLVARVFPADWWSSSNRITVQRSSEQQYEWLRLMNVIVNPATTLLDSYYLTQDFSIHSLKAVFLLAFFCKWFLEATHVSTHSDHQSTCHCTRCHPGNVAYYKIIKE